VQRNISKLIILLILAWILTYPASAQVLSDKLEKINNDSHDSLVTVVVFLENSSKKSELTKFNSIQKNRKNQITKTLDYLNNNYSQYENELLDFLNDNNQKLLHRHKIISAYTIEINSFYLNRLSALPGVIRIVENADLVFYSPVKSDYASSYSSSIISYELELLGVPSLWEKGLNGKGRLVCSFDTGVDSDHPALSGKWRGNTSHYQSAWFTKSSQSVFPVVLKYFPPARDRPGLQVSACRYNVRRGL